MGVASAADGRGRHRRVRAKMRYAIVIEHNEKGGPYGATSPMSPTCSGRSNFGGGYRRFRSGLATYWTFLKDRGQEAREPRHTGEGNGLTEARAAGSRHVQVYTEGPCPRVAGWDRAQIDVSRRIMGAIETAQAAAHFAGSIRAKRETLQTLFYAAKNSWAEARALQLRYDALPPLDLYSVPGNGGGEHAAVLDGKLGAEATAQDSAVAFIIICDYSLQRLRSEGGAADTRTLGLDAYGGVKLNQAIWALGNQARHLHEWQQNRWDPKSYEVLVRLGLFPTYHDAARLFLEKLNLASYVDFEERLTHTAIDALKGSGFELTRNGPGIVTLTMVGSQASS